MTPKQRIVEKATDMFLREGVKAIRMDDIASALGVSKRTIYELFGNKENLITECASCFFKRHNQLHQEQTSSAANLIEEIMMMIDIAEEHMATNLKCMDGIKKFYPSIYEKIVHQCLKEEFTSMKEKMQCGINDGLLVKNFNLDFAITMFAESLFNAFSHPHVLLSNNISQIDAFRYLTIYFFRGLATPKGLEIIDSFIAAREKERKKRAEATALQV